MRFPQTFIDDLRRQADIVRVIQDYVSLKKKGANWMACCPFHQEKTPSFSVNPAKDIFYCFGCGKGGSVFNFVMEIERVSFPEAIKIVAEKANVALPAMVEDQKFEARRKEADEIIELNSWVLEWWEGQLEQNNVEVRAAREYLTGRGISDETRKAFRLGYAPDSWDALSTYLKQRGASAAQIERSGLVVKKDAGGFYDRFRGRLIFPVLDAQGRAVAFGGRTLQPDGEPKYLNSPETAAYTKGRHLFGLNLTRDEIRKRKFAILVEGYLDLIIPYQFGVRNMVASLGTALTPEQAKLLGRFARKVVVNYDGDSAGMKAAKRSIETLLAEDLEIKVLVLPAGADPDEFIKERSVEEYERRRGEMKTLSPADFFRLKSIKEYNKQRGSAVPYIQFVINHAVRDRNLLRPADKAAAAEEVLPFIRAVRNSIQKREYFDMAMDELDIEEPALRKELWQTIKANSQAAPDVRQKIVRAASAQPTMAEQRLLELLIHDEELRHTILPRMEASDYEELPTASIFRALIELNAAGQSIDFDSLSAQTEDDDEEIKKLVALVWWSEPQREKDEAEDAVLASAESCLNTLRLMTVERKINELGTELADAERRGDAERGGKLALEYREWAMRKKQLSDARSS